MFLYNITRKCAVNWLSNLFGHGNSSNNSSNSPPDEFETASQADLEKIASDFMINEEWKVLGSQGEESADDEPAKSNHDHYYSTVERERFELPHPSSTGTKQRDHWCIRWQKGLCLGRGSFGTVYLGLNLDNGELMAVKQVVLPGEDLEHNNEVRALQQEINILRTVEHHSIVRYLGSSVEGSFFNIFLEYVPGGSLASVIKRFGVLNEKIIRLYTKQILQGLEYLHSRQIIHRDIKGANILVQNGGIKLADFGAAKQLGGIIRGSASGGCYSLKGTVYWMAPEVIRQANYGRQADIWSLGCTIIEMATGKPPWVQQFSEQVTAMWNIVNGDALPTIPDTLSPLCHDFLALCFRRNPRLRPNAKKLLTHQWITSPSPFTSPNSSALPSPTVFAGRGDLFEINQFINQEKENNFNNHDNNNQAFPSTVPQLQLPQDKFKKPTTTVASANETDNENQNYEYYNVEDNDAVQNNNSRIYDSQQDAAQEGQEEEQEEGPEEQQQNNNNLMETENTQQLLLLPEEELQEEIQEEIQEDEIDNIPQNYSSEFLQTSRPDMNYDSDEPQSPETEEPEVESEPVQEFYQNYDEIQESDDLQLSSSLSQSSEPTTPIDGPVGPRFLPPEIQNYRDGDLAIGKHYDDDSGDAFNFDDDDEEEGEEIYNDNNNISNDNSNYNSYNNSNYNSSSYSNKKMISIPHQKRGKVVEFPTYNTRSRAPFNYNNNVTKQLTKLEDTEESPDMPGINDETGITGIL